MEFLTRKLLSDDDDEEFCNLHCLYACPSVCVSKCPKLCYKLLISIPPPDYFNPPSSPSKSPRKLHNLVTSTIALLSFTFLLVLCYAIYVRFYSGRRRRRRPGAPPSATHQQDFLDEEQGPVVDHPIWYIRTIGLPPAVISAIAVCKFKSGDGLIDGTECSVCLSEFEEDETLRLLPKCSHAFHLPCIDTWLRSHTNCPMCRAPVVAQSAPVAAPPPPVVGSEEIEMRDLERDEGDGVDLGENSVRDEEEQDEVGLGGDELEERVSDFQPVRRSVSLDSVSALGISSMLAVLREKVDSEAELGQRNGNSSKKSDVTGGCSAAINRSVSCSGKFLMRSSTHRSSSGTNQN